MRDKSDRYRFETVPLPIPSKRLGSYLVDAGLITTDQVSVALNDQSATGMKFGEVLVARGWVKEQTVEWVMQKVVMPERKSRQQPEQAAVSRSTAPPQSSHKAPSPPKVDVSSGDALMQRRDVPISKPLPPVNSSDDAVNWVG